MCSGSGLFWLVTTPSFDALYINCWEKNMSIPLVCMASHIIRLGEVNLVNAPLGLYVSEIFKPKTEWLFMAATFHQMEIFWMLCA